MPSLLVAELGSMPYAEALALQRAVAKARISGDIAEDVLLLVEHPAVVTLGRSSKEQHLLASPALLASRGVELYEVERGGDVTFHGPGQVVGYPIVDLKRHKKDLHWYLRQVEEGIIRAIAPFGIQGERSTGYTGVWTHGRKIASIGVHARDWVTWHGFALNVTTDLRYFDLIVPCGISAVEMTSVARESSTASVTDAQLVDDVRRSLRRAFADVFSLTAATLDPAELDRVAASAVAK